MFMWGLLVRQHCSSQFPSLNGLFEVEKNSTLLIMDHAKEITLTSMYGETVAVDGYENQLH